MRLRKEQFAGLLTRSKKGVAPLPLGLAFQEYELKDGKIFPKGDTDWQDEDRAEDERLFLSFASLGSAGKPSEKAILNWVHRYGLLWREETRPEDDAMNIEDFRREVLCVRQILVLYEAVRSRNPDILKRLSGGDMGRWQYALPTEIDKHKHLYDLEHSKRSLMGAQELLRWVLQEKMKNVMPTFAEPANPTDEVRFRQAWYCRDLLSAIYLSFYLFATEGNPVGYCQICGQPMEMTRSDKRFCGATCRSNARHRRNRELEAR